MDDRTLTIFGDSLSRCSANPDFLDLFYEAFLGSSPKIREKFANTDFVKQKRALHASLNLMLRAAREEDLGPPRYLDDLARRHGAHDLDIGAEYYDLWLDSLLATVAVCDPQVSEEVRGAWEKVMGVGIRYLCARYNE